MKFSRKNYPIVTAPCWHQDVRLCRESSQDLKFGWKSDGGVEQPFLITKFRHVRGGLPHPPCPSFWRKAEFLAESFIFNPIFDHKAERSDERDRGDSEVAAITISLY